MANFSPSNLVKAQAILKKNFTEPEMRKKQSAVLGLALKNSDVLIPSHKVLRTREDRTVEAAINKRSIRSAGTARTALHTGNRGDSMIVTPSWNQFVDTFSMSVDQMENNIFSFDEAFAQEIRNACINLHEAIETAGVDYLVAQRTQVNGASQVGSFNATNDSFEISADNRERFYQNAKSMMRQNKYSGMFDVVASPKTFVDAEFYLSQGNSNAVNTAFQFAGLNILESIELEDANYDGGISLILPENTFGALTWIPGKNRRGWGDGELNEVGRFMSMPDPFGSGLDFAMSVYAKREDSSGSNGSVQDVTLQFEVSVDVAWLLAPLSTANASVVHQVSQML